VSVVLARWALSRCRLTVAVLVRCCQHPDNTTYLTESAARRGRRLQFGGGMDPGGAYGGIEALIALGKGPDFGDKLDKIMDQLSTTSLTEDADPPVQTGASGAAARDISMLRFYVGGNFGDHRDYDAAGIIGFGSHLTLQDSLSGRCAAVVVALYCT
jgi:hypothetical protein